MRDESYYYGVCGDQSTSFIFQRTVFFSSDTGRQERKYDKTGEGIAWDGKLREGMGRDGEGIAWEGKRKDGNGREGIK